MSAQPPGRRTESLFDNRYRYDYIYPRGRSGETLRAYDTYENDHPVVIKRPAPQDAPPMRAGQEVSIRTEKQALERLSGHPVLTELRGSGTFRVGGHTHEYIVMDLARGQIVEDMVLELAHLGAYLPDLETLVIIDNLLDLLAHAHDKQVIYNDVDAKHLFWDRENYRLKVIDWGNAVFTDEPGALPTVTRATDIYQVGELLYFILTGGNRLNVEVEEGSDTFFVNFGPDAERIPARLQAILTRAVHPDPRRRFGTIRELRHALTEYRLPLEKTRDEIISRVRKRVRPTASQEELVELNAALSTALDMDPGYPEATALAAEIQYMLRQITIQADLDAIRIYLESGNWPRALSLLHDLLPGADAGHQPLVRFLIAAAATLDELHLSPPPEGFLDALGPLFRGDAAAAGYSLLTTDDPRPNARHAEWLLAEHLTSYIPEVTLLRPHLVHLRQKLQDVPEAAPALKVLDQIDAELATTPLPGLTGLQVIYQQVGALLGQLQDILQSSGTGGVLPALESLLDSVTRAQGAANDLVTRLEAVGQHVYGDPASAGDLLHKATMIDPTSPHFEVLHNYFDEVHQAITALAQFKPRSDGTNLTEWFADVQDFIQPYLEDLPDRQLHDAAESFRRAAEGWTTTINYLALGRRQPTVKVLHETSDAIRPFNENMAAWLGALANRVPDAPFPEQLSPNGALTEKLIEGWKTWDHGDGIYAAELARRAYEQATTDGERLAANRLRRLGELLDAWLADNGPQDSQRTDQTETQSLAVLLTEEEQERRTFAEQMPNTTLYLRAMSRGIVAYMHQSSSAGWRALYLHYVLRGVLALLEDQLDEADFWRNAASKCFDNARTHRAFQVLDRALTGRRLVQNAEQALNAIAGPRDLDAARQALNAPLAGELLAGAQQSIQMINDALRDWSDGDFYAARQALDAAVQNIQRAVETAHLHIDPFVNWLTRLRDAAADLHQARLSVEQGAVSTSEQPDPAIAGALSKIVTVTLETLGPDYAHQVRQWEEMYQAVLDTYTTQRMARREKLAAFDRHFASLFITRHPAYPLFRHWESIVEQLPPDEPEDDMIQLEESPPVGGEETPAYLEEDREPEPAPKRESGSDLPWNWIIAGAVVLLIAALGLAVLRSMGGDQNPSGEIAIRPTEVLGTAPVVRPDNTQPAAAVAPTRTAALTAVVVQPSDTPTWTPVPPTVTPTSPPPTVTPSTIPTETSAPTLFVTSTLIPSQTPAPVAAVPLSDSNRDVLVALTALPENAWPGPQGAFAPGDGGAWILSTANGDNSQLTIELPPGLLNAMFQPGTATTLRRADAVFELISYDQTALSDGETGFGLGAKNIDGQQTIGQVQFVESNFISLGLNQNGQFRSSTQFPQQKPQIALSVRRTNANTLSFYVDDRWLGDSVFLFPQGEPLALVLFASGKNVVVQVSAFEIDFSPRDEIP
jgi:hypothetical protein